MSEKFNYIVARIWPGTGNHLCTYAYGTQVLYGTQEDADNFLAYVKSKPDKENKDYKIIKIPTDVFMIRNAIITTIKPLFAKRHRLTECATSIEPYINQEYRRNKMDDKDLKIESLEKEVKRLSQIATDHRYMMQAYKAMLGPLALQVVKAWEDKGVTRQHSSWGPEAYTMTGEERAKVLLDVEKQISVPLDFNDSHAPVSKKTKTNVRDWVNGLSD